MLTYFQNFNHISITNEECGVFYELEINGNFTEENLRYIKAYGENVVRYSNNNYRSHVTFRFDNIQLI